MIFTVNECTSAMLTITYKPLTENFILPLIIGILFVTYNLGRA